MHGYGNILIKYSLIYFISDILDTLICLFNNCCHSTNMMICSLNNGQGHRHGVEFNSAERPWVYGTYRRQENVSTVSETDYYKKTGHRERQAADIGRHPRRHTTRLWARRRRLKVKVY